MSPPPPVHAHKPPEWFQDGQNSRDTIVVDDAIKELCYSLVANGFLQSVGAIDHGDHGEQLYGFRRMAAFRWGLSQKLAMPSQIPANLYPPSLLVTQRRIITATENLQRQDLSDPETFRLCKELMTLNPDWARQDLGKHLNKSASMVTQCLSPDDLIPEALEAFLAGKFGFGKAYAIARSPNQMKTYLKVIGGASRDAALGECRKQRNGSAPAVRVSKIKCPLPSGIVITASGADLSLDDFIEALGIAIKEAKKALDQGLDSKTFAAVVRDKAKAS